MRIPRIYCDIPLSCGETVLLSDTASQHVLRVLRLQPGAPLRVFNGQGGEFTAALLGNQNRCALVKLQDFSEPVTDYPGVLHLGQGVSRGERMDYAIQKATELGATDITPVLTARCGVKLSADRWQKRLAHWRAVAISACEQCGRCKLPTIHPAISLSDWVSLANDNESNNKFVCAIDEPAKSKKNKATGNRENSSSTTTVLIGPEGGLSEDELAQCYQHNFQALDLGPRILRTETATVVALTLLTQNRSSTIT